jgi:hypothetical protein
MLIDIYSLIAVREVRPMAFLIPCLISFIASHFPKMSPFQPCLDLESGVLGLEVLYLLAVAPQMSWWRVYSTARSGL